MEFFENLHFGHELSSGKML